MEPPDPNAGEQGADPRHVPAHRRWAAFLSRALVSAALVAVLAARVDWRRVTAELDSLAAAPLLASLVIAIASVALQVWRWQLLLRGFGVAVERRERVRLTLGANCLGLLLPGNLAGDAYRVVGSRAAAAGFLRSSGVVIVERYFGFLATFLAAFVALVTSDFALRFPGLSSLVVALFLIMLAPLLLAARRPEALVAGWLRRAKLERFTPVLARSARGLRRVLGQPRLVLALFSVSLAMKLGVVLVIWLLGQSMGLALAPGDLLVLLPLHNLVSALPVSLGGLGAREANLVAFLVHTGVAVDQAAGLALLHLVWLYATAAPGCLFLWRGRRPSLSPSSSAQP
jgi:uncharacterized protein (TIRG00374 family)